MRYTILSLLISLMLLSCRSTTLEPVGGSTSIRYGVPEQSHVKIEIVNTYDTAVAKLVDEIQAAGAYMVNFALSDYDLAEGVYFIKFYLDKELISKSTLIAVNP